MKARVSTLYRDGLRLQSPKIREVVIGDLNLSVSRHPVSVRASVVACVLSDNGTSLVPDIMDAQCQTIAATGMLLRGVEWTKGKEYAQEWWVVPIGEAANENKKNHTG